MARCGWCANDALYMDYHDREWGVPQHDDRVLFEFLLLEGAQAGLSWITVLRKRERYREVMAGFDPAVAAGWGEAKLVELMQDAGIIRNRRKLASVVQNAQAFLTVQAQFGSFDRYLWSFVDGQPLQGCRQSLGDVPAETPLAQALSKDLKRRGFHFVGPTICYSFMQAVGLVNDHVTDCFRYAELGGPDLRLQGENPRRAEFR